MREIERAVVAHPVVTGLGLILTGGALWEIALIDNGPLTPVWSTLCALLMLAGAAIVILVGMKALLRKRHGDPGE